MMATAAAAAEEESAIPGQFDDAEDENQYSNPQSAVVAGEAQSKKIKTTATVASSRLDVTTTRTPSAPTLVEENEEEEDYDDDEGDYYYYYDYDDDDEPLVGGGSGGNMNNTSGASNSSKRMNLSHSVANSVARMQEMETHKRTLTIGRDDRATSEQVLDPRTRLILFKLLSRGFLQVIDGCLSTGKEANVYYAKAGKKGLNSSSSFGNNNNHNHNNHTVNNSRNNKSSVANKSSKAKKQQQKDTVKNNAEITAVEDELEQEQNAAAAVVTEYAIKIYKTSILVFKDRDKYVAGEHRWRKGYCKSNPRKMVKVWAEKEMRNYRRIYSAGIPCPQPILLKSHVLVMEFLGQDGWPSPRLKDAQLSERKLRQAYVECVLIMRRLFQKCRLVHGDLSEYNLLWHDNQVYVIDVSQSVETDHPSALDFLRKDAANINDFFSKGGRGAGQEGLQCMTVRQLFEFITTPLLFASASSNSSSCSSIDTDETEAELAALDAIMKHVEENQQRLSRQTEQGRREAQQQEDVDEAVFMSSFLPRSLNQMAEHEIQQLQNGQVEETYAHAVAALTGNADNVVQQPQQQDTVPATTTPTVQSIMTTINSSTTMDPAQDASSRATKDRDSGEVKDDNVDEDEDSDNDDDESDESASDDEDEDDDDDDDDSAFVKVARTPEELKAEKDAKKAERKANKRAVKEARSDKRKDKIKKKDKKRAIKKSKAGNRKNR